MSTHATRSALFATVTMLALGTCLSAATEGATTTTRRPTLHLVGQPVAYYPAAHPRHGFALYVRLSDSPPRTASGSLQLALALEGTGSPASRNGVGTIGHDGRHCYFDSNIYAYRGPLRHPRDGGHATARIEIGTGAATEVITAQARLQAYTTYPRSQRSNPVLRKLGCVNRRAANR